MNPKLKYNQFLNNISLSPGIYENKIVVVKFGGAAMDKYSLNNSFCNNIKILKSLGFKIVIVHGGGKEVSAMSNRLNIPVKFINGLRYTDSATMEVVQMVLAGLTNKKIVSSLYKKGIKAIGLSGIDGALFSVKKYSKNKQDLGFVGVINKVNTELIHDLLANHYTPVIAPVGIIKNDSYNINADDAASRIAGELKAEKLIYISDVEGIKVNGKIISKIDNKTARDLIRRKIIINGMIPKLLSSFDALSSGVKRVHLINGSSKSAMLKIFAGIESGTEIYGLNKEKQKNNLFSQIRKAS